MTDSGNFARKFFRLKRLAAAAEQLCKSPVLHLHSVIVSDSLEVEVFSFLRSGRVSACYVWIDPSVPDASRAPVVCLLQTVHICSADAAVAYWLRTRCAAA